jgi:hypothetical protein
VSIIRKLWAGWLGEQFPEGNFFFSFALRTATWPTKSPSIGYQALSEKTTRRGRRFHQFRPSTTEVKAMNLLITSDLRNSDWHAVYFTRLGENSILAI